MSAPTINEHQVAELRRFVKEHADDEDVSASFGERPHPINRLAWYDCEVPGTVAVLDADGFVMKLLLPVPRPVNRDPLFQPAGAVSDYRKLAVLTMSRREFLRDLQWATGVVMDAPDTMPAGACEYMSASEEAFGAMQMTWDRPGRWDDASGVKVHYSFRCYSCQHEWEGTAPDEDCPAPGCGTTNRYSAANPAHGVATRHPRCGYPYCACVSQCFAASQPAGWHVSFDGGLTWEYHADDPWGRLGERAAIVRPLIYGDGADWRTAGVAANQPNRKDGRG